MIISQHLSKWSFFFVPIEIMPVLISDQIRRDVNSMRFFMKGKWKGQTNVTKSKDISFCVLNLKQVSNRKTLSYTSVILAFFFQWSQPLDPATSYPIITQWTKPQSAMLGIFHQSQKGGKRKHWCHKIQMRPMSSLLLCSFIKTGRSFPQQTLLG